MQYDDFLQFMDNKWMLLRYVVVMLGLTVFIYGPSIVRKCARYYVARVIQRRARKTRELLNRVDQLKRYNEEHPVDLMNIKAARVVAICSNAPSVATSARSSATSATSATSDDMHVPETGPMTMPSASSSIRQIDASPMYDITRIYNDCFENIELNGPLYTLLPDMVPHGTTIVIIELDHACWFSDWRIIINISPDGRITDMRAHAPLCAIDMNMAMCRINDD